MGRQKWKRVERDVVTGVPAGSEQPTVYIHPCVQLFLTPWAIDCQAPLPKGFPWLEYQSGLPFPSSGDLPDPRIKPASPALQADSLPSEPPGKVDMEST